MTKLTKQTLAEGGVVTRTPATEVQYRRVSKMLLDRYQAEVGEVEAIEWADVAAWASQLPREYQPRTWRLYRAALAAAAEADGEPDVAEQFRGIKADSRRNVREPRGAALKLKGGANEMLLTLLRTIGSSAQEGSHLSRAGFWLRATMVAGLRPTEWLDATLTEDGDGVRLLVANAKATNDRANGVYRTIWLNRAPPREIAIVRAHIQNVASWLEANQRPDESTAAAFGRHQAVIAATVRRAARGVWPRKASVPCLYTARHQFSANAKAYGHGFSGVAALMGHASNQTAYSHYARVTSGVAADCFADPDPREEASVRDTMGWIRELQRKRAATEGAGDATGSGERSERAPKSDKDFG